MRFHPLHVPRYWLLALLPIWAVVFAILVKMWLTQQVAWMPVFIEPRAGDYPVVSEIQPDAGVEASGIELDDRLLRAGARRRNWVPTATTRLEVGDELIRVGSEDLRGVSRLEFVGRVYEQSGSDLQAQFVIERDGERQAATLPLFKEFFPDHVKTLIALAFAIVGVLILWRAPDTRTSRLFYLSCLTISIYVASVLGPGPAAQNYFMLGIYAISSGLFAPLQLLALMALVDTTETAPARLPRWPWIFLIAAFSPLARLMAWPVAWKTAFLLQFSLAALVLSLCVLVVIGGFRRADALGRRRLKWVVYGYIFGFGPLAVLNLVAAGFPSVLWIANFSNYTLLLVPLSVLIAAVRSQLFDIDRLLSATTTFSILAALLLVGLLTLAPPAAAFLSAATGLDASAAQTVLSLLMAALMVPGYGYLRPWLDRVFFAERQILERGVEDLLLALSSCTSAPAVFTRAGEALDELLRPESCLIYVRNGSAYARVFARGKDGPPALPLGGVPVGILQKHNAAQTISQFAKRLSAESVDGAVVASLGAAALLPITRGDKLLALICLGRKRSGDVYIGSELVLLTRVAHALSRELRRFEESELGETVHATAAATEGVQAGGS